MTPTQPAYSASDTATYRDGDGVTHVACCYTEAATRTTPAYRWSVLFCDTSRTGGALRPGETDAIHSWPTCLRCVALSLATLDYDDDAWRFML